MGSFNMSPFPLENNSAREETSGATLAMDHLLLQWSLEKVSRYLSTQHESYQKAISTCSSTLASLEANKQEASRRLNSARSYVMEHDTEVFEVLNSEGTASQSYSFKLLRPGKSPVLRFELKAKFPIRKVDRKVVPSSAIDYDKSGWQESWRRLGTLVFQDQLKVKRMQSCRATVTLYGRKKEIYCEEIKQQKKIIAEQEKLLQTIMRNIQNAQRSSKEAKLQNSHISHALEMCKADIERTTKGAILNNDDDGSPRSFHYLATSLGLEMVVEPAWFPEAVKEAKAPDALIAGQVELLLKEMEYLADQEKRFDGIINKRGSVLEEIEDELTENLRSAEHKPEDTFDMMREECETKIQKADKGVADEAKQVLSGLDEEWAKFEGQCMKGLVETKTDMLDDADAAWAAVKRCVMDCMKISGQEQGDYVATREVFNRSAVPISLFAGVDNKRNMFEEYKLMLGEFRAA